MPAKPSAEAEVVARVNSDVITLAAYQKAEQTLRDESDAPLPELPASSRSTPSSKISRPLLPRA